MRYFTNSKDNIFRLCLFLYLKNIYIYILKIYFKFFNIILHHFNILISKTNFKNKININLIYFQIKKHLKIKHNHCKKNKRQRQ